MPDRAVVDEDYWTAPFPKQGPMRCPLCDGEMVPTIDGTWACYRDHTPKPRAVVALSEDRQWLCALTPTEPTAFFVICGWDCGDLGVGHAGWPMGWGNVGEPRLIPDTGQDAHEVLAAWERQQG